MATCSCVLLGSRKSVAGWAWMLLLHCCWCLLSTSQEGAREVSFSCGFAQEQPGRRTTRCLKCFWGASAHRGCDVWLWPCTSHPQLWECSLGTSAAMLWQGAVTLTPVRCSKGFVCSWCRALGFDQVFNTLGAGFLSSSNWACAHSNHSKSMWFLEAIFNAGCVCYQADVFKGQVQLHQSWHFSLCGTLQDQVSSKSFPVLQMLHCSCSMHSDSYHSVIKGK